MTHLSIFLRQKTNPGPQLSYPGLLCLSEHNTFFPNEVRWQRVPPPYIDVALRLAQDLCVWTSGSSAGLVLLRHAPLAPSLTPLIRNPLMPFHEPFLSRVPKVLVMVTLEVKLRCLSRCLIVCATYPPALRISPSLLGSNTPGFWEGCFIIHLLSLFLKLVNYGFLNGCTAILADAFYNFFHTMFCLFVLIYKAFFFMC